MGKKRKSDATRLDEVDRGMYTTPSPDPDSGSQIFSPQPRPRLTAPPPQNRRLPLIRRRLQVAGKNLPRRQHRHRRRWFKGVVPQPNGRWGAQIYEKHQRVWIDTFNEEHEAARAYDTAAQRFCGCDAVTNFLPLSESDEVEAAFLASHSKSEIVDMLRKHTYADELGQSRRSCCPPAAAAANPAADTARYLGHIDALGAV